MKEVTSSYERLETAVTNKPQELYHFWLGEAHWTHTSGDAQVTFMGRTYAPAAISRGSVIYNSNMEVSQLTISIARTDDPILKYIAENPVEIVWVEVLRIFRGSPSAGSTVIFIGQIKGVSFKGVTATVQCVGFEAFLKQPIPIDRYGPQCNATLFDERCQVDAEAGGFVYELEGITVSSAGLEITHEDLLEEDAGFFTLGFIEWGQYKRMVVDHYADKAFLRYPIPDLVTGENITIYAGCDCNLSTCKDKFNNVLNFRGMPYIPMDNPVAWD